MSTDPDLPDIIVFAVPNPRLARDLVGRLEERWACCAHDEPGVTVVGGFLPPVGGAGLGPLLRSVEAWVAEHALTAITFWLDGRGYVLWAHDEVSSDRIPEPLEQIHATEVKHARPV